MENACQVPLLELLQRVPARARHIEEDKDGFGTSFHPVGRLCHEAADALAAKDAELLERGKALTWASEEMMTKDVEIARLREALNYIGQHSSSDWPERCLENVQTARDALKGTP